MKKAMLLLAVLFCAPIVLLSQYNYNYYVIQSYECTPNTCSNYSNTAPGGSAQVDSDITATCGTPNPIEPSAHAGVYVVSCPTAQSLVTFVETDSTRQYDPDIGMFEVGGVRGVGDITDTLSQIVWYAGEEGADCDGDGYEEWPPFQPCPF